MLTTPGSLLLDPRRALSLELPRLEGRLRRATLRGLLALSAGTVRVEGSERLAAAPEPSIFALTHHNAWEAVLAPATLIALRGGRMIRFLVDWMFVDLPWTGWLVRQGEPIPVYAKPALLRLGEAHRLARRRRSAFTDALAALAAGQDVGVYPEGRRNSDPWLLSPPRRGVGALALRAGIPVVPIGIDFEARDRLLRTPLAGRFALRVGEPIDVAAEHGEWRGAASEPERRRIERRLEPALLDRVFAELARLSRKVHALGASRAAGLSAETAKPELSRERPLAAAPTISAAKVLDAASRAAALQVLEDVYREEKGWLRDVAAEIAEDPAADTAHTWLLARAGGRPAGVLRLTWDPPLAPPAGAGLELDAGVELDRLAGSGRFVEVGRLTILPAWRSRPAIVLELMRAAIGEVVARGYSHLFTVVFEDDPHSPYRFHTRVLGFERIGTHRRGELACASRRILLVLDLARAWRSLRARRARFASQLARGVEGLEDRLDRLAPSSAAEASGPGTV